MTNKQIAPYIGHKLVSCVFKERVDQCKNRRTKTIKKQIKKNSTKK